MAGPCRTMQTKARSNDSRICRFLTYCNSLSNSERFSHSCAICYYSDEQAQKSHSSDLHYMFMALHSSIRSIAIPA